MVQVRKSTKKVILDSSWKWSDFEFLELNCLPRYTKLCSPCRFGLSSPAGARRSVWNGLAAAAIGGVLGIEISVVVTFSLARVGEIPLGAKIPVEAF